MQDDKPPSIFQTIFNELKLGNPIIILAVLTVLLMLGMVWVWQSISTPVVLTPDVIVHHPTLVYHPASEASITAPALRSDPTATATQAAFVPDRVVVTTHQLRPLAFLAGTFHETRIFSR